MNEDLKSSYNNKILSFGTIFRLLSWKQKPELIVEFGILNGYSLKNFIDGFPQAKIDAYDIFENFNGNSAKRDIIEKFRMYDNVSINEGDYYKKYADYDNESIDILHIDIANDGNTYEFAFEKYMPKLKKNGIMIMEGGSEERDNISWMIKYNKVAIQSILEKYKEKYDIFIIDEFPSLTIIRKNEL
jgi:predicted O-methyltransferase YrrM